MGIHAFGAALVNPDSTLPGPHRPRSITPASAYPHDTILHPATRLTTLTKQDDANCPDPQPAAPYVSHQNHLRSLPPSRPKSLAQLPQPPNFISAQCDGTLTGKC